MTDAQFYQGLFNAYAKKMLCTYIGPMPDRRSLARTDSYRGKYPHMGPRPLECKEGTVTDGELYPLTNKLDYVFFKRHMVPSETKDGHVNKWVEVTEEKT